MEQLNLLRFAHCFNSGGGTERYLEDLDTALLKKKPYTIFRIQFSEQGEREYSEKAVGLGKVVTIGLPRHTVEAKPEQPSHHPSFLKTLFRDYVLYNPLVWTLFTERKIENYNLKLDPGQITGAGQEAENLFKEHKIDLCMMHYFGGADAEAVILAAKKAKVPVALQNHYSNDRFLHFAIRKHALLADGLSGVNALQLPKYIGSRFQNLSDGVDTNFFKPAEAEPENDELVILLPARVVPEKGQADLIDALAELHGRFPQARIALAGRATDENFNAKLRNKAEAHGLTEKIDFLGDLNVHELKEQYARCAFVAFPTYHHEGLGRIIVEAQAMCKPVIAYATGGVAEGIIDGKTGFLVKTGDQQALNQKTALLLESKELRERLGVAGRTFAERQFSLQALADRHLAFYQDTLSHHISESGQPPVTLK